MNTNTPQIGFDRFIKLEWATAALRVRAATCGMEEFTSLIDNSHPGTAAKKKTRTVLNRLWLEPRPELVEFADRAAAIYRSSPDTKPTLLSWGMAIATYPFFGRVAEIVGRLTSLQGDCTSAEVHRRMAEMYGEREGTRRMTNMVLQSQEDWGTILRSPGGKRVSRKPAEVVEQPDLIAWLAEACLRFSDRSLSIGAVAGLPVIYPFDIAKGLAYAVSNSAHIDVRSDGGGSQVIDISRSSIVSMRSHSDA